MMFVVMLSSVFIGRWVSRVGLWKPFVLAGAIILAIGFGTMATITATTALWLIGVYSGVAGVGLGMTMQNLVLAVQNSVSVRDVGAASAAVTFFRSLGGTIGIQVLGVVFAGRVHGLAVQRMEAAKVPGAASALAESGGSQSMDLSAMPHQVETIIRGAYGDAISLVFLVAALVALASVVAVASMHSTRLRDRISTDPNPPDAEPPAKEDGGKGA
jgi:hypothetical protein